MRTKLNSLIAVSLTSMVLLGCSTTHHGRPVAWEYRVVEGSTVNQGLEQKLNEAGKEGFVIDSAVPMPIPPSQVGGIPQTMVILKRPVR